MGVNPAEYLFKRKKIEKKLKKAQKKDQGSQLPTTPNQFNNNNVGIVIFGVLAFHLHSSFEW